MADIAYENDRAWVLKDAKGARYTVFLAGDLYAVRFYSSRGVNVTERGEFEMIYGDRLAALFTEQTGFDTHL